LNHVSASRWVVIGVFGLLSVLCFLAGINLMITRGGAASSRDVQDSQKRTDCRSAYNADFTEVVRTQTNLSIELQQQLTDALLASQRGERATAEDAARYQATSSALTAATAAVKALPKLDDAVDHGYTLNGVHHPACPG
jgi:hypothetical protein